MRVWVAALLLASSGGLLGCFGASSQARSYYVLNASPTQPSGAGTIPGLLRIRNLDTASAYDKFQIVIRRSPFELRYAESHVWAVKPNRMVSDLIGRVLAESGTFEAVMRELGETRPAYVLGGDIQAIEIYDSDDIWFAHLAFSLRLTSFDTGEPLWSFNFDERKQVHTQNYSLAVRTLSELFSIAVDEAIAGMAPLRASAAAAGAAGVSGAAGRTDADAAVEADAVKASTPTNNSGPVEPLAPAKPPFRLAPVPGTKPQGKRRVKEPIYVPVHPPAETGPL